MDAFVERPAQRGSLALQVGARIRMLRKQRNMTLAQLGTACGTTPQTAQRFETGNMTLSLLWVERIAAALDVKPYELLADGALAELQQGRMQAEARMASLRGAFSTFCESVVATYGEEELRG